MVEFGVESPEYRELLALRLAELREPLGMTWTEAEMVADQGDRHFGLKDRGAWVGSVVVSRVDGNFVKLRQIAVTGRRQGEGLGRILMEKIEEKLCREETAGTVLNARKTVAGFYEALGYEQEGGEFEEIGLPHVRMTKALRRGSA